MMRVANRFRAILFCGFAVISPSLWGGENLPAKPGETVIPNQYLVKSAPGVNLSQVIPSVLPGGGYYPLTKSLGLVVTSDATVVSALASHPLVEYVEPNRPRTLNLDAINDPYFASQWALQTVQAVQAWQLVPGRYLTSSNPEAGRIKVAVLDTGADCTHPDFADAGGTSDDSAAGGQFSFALSQAYTPTSIAPAACPWQDDHGHGTHTAGIVAAAAANAIGVAGLGYPVELIIYKVLDKNGSGNDGTIAAAITAASDAGVRVISMSLGGTGYSQSLQAAINYAWQHDVVVVAATGNSGSNTPFFPGASNYVIGVGSTNSAGAVSGFSNYGNQVDVTAPGENILSTVPTYPVTEGVQNYAYMSGTSMATPHVAAIAGLIATSTSSAPAAAIVERIQQSANSSVANGGWDQYFGYGIVNAFNAVSGSLRPSGVGGLVGQVKDTSDMPVAGAQLTVNNSTITTDSSGLYRAPNLAPGAYTVTVSSTSFPAQAVSATIIPGADTNLSVVLGAHYGEFSGIVTDTNSTAMASAVVQALSGGLVQATAFTDTTGHYSLWVATSGSYDIRAFAIGSATATAPSNSVAAAGNTVVNLTLSRFGAIAGVVRDTSQNPLAGAQLVISAGNYTIGAVTGADGSYASLGLPPGTYAVTATATGQPNTLVSGVVVGSTIATVNITMGSGANTPVSVTLSPASPTVPAGKTVQFTATVSGSANTAVTWTLSPQVGSINGPGLYTAPTTISNNVTIVVTATSAADATKSAATTITVTPAAPPVAISVTPSIVSLSSSNTQQFTATVTGTSNTAVTWSMSPVVGQLSSSGLYTAPASITSAQTVTITAASVADPTKSAIANVNLQPASGPPPNVAVTITPWGKTIALPQTMQFSASVAGSSNQAVIWNLRPQVGQIDANGLYTPPATIPSMQLLTVTATSAANTSVSSSVALFVKPGTGGVVIVLSPTTVTLGPGQSQSFVANVTATSNTSVTWSLSPNLGALSNGVYTAPAQIAAAQSVTVTATSVADPSKTATAIVNLSPPVAISLNPASVNLAAGQSQQFTAQVTGTGNTGVNWTASPPGVGTLANGAYTAPASISASQTVTITATSQADPTKSAAAAVNLVPSVGVSVGPSSVSLTAGQSQQFTASVTGSGNTAVTWSLSPNVGTISNGLYIAPATINAAQTIVLTATSQADASKSATATVNLVNAVAVTVGPPIASLNAGQSQQFTATVTGSANSGVVWTLVPNVGAISNGLYTAPAAINAPQTIVVIATSQADSTRSATANVNLVPTVGVSVGPSSVSLTANQSQQFTASVTGSVNTTVTWSLTPNVGTISNGQYTVPAAINAPQTVIVTATSQADSTKSATAMVNLVATVAVSIGPSSVNLTANQSQQFTVSVTGAVNIGVTWSLSPNVGTISNGFYTAPPSVNAPQTITVTATSKADGSKSASALVYLYPAVGISVSPASVTLTAGQSQQFTSFITGSSNAGVTWSLNPNVGTISNGLYTAPPSVSGSQAVTVTATSQADNTKSASAVVSLQPSQAVGITLTPAQVGLNASQSLQFTATVTGSPNTSVTWTVSPSNLGTFVNGFYTAPANLTTQQTVTVTATSVADPTRSASAMITLLPPLFMSVGPPGVVLHNGQSQAYRVNIVGLVDTSVTWNVRPSRGSISAKGVYTAPANVTGPEIITITATSNANTAYSTSTYVILKP